MIKGITKATRAVLSSLLTVLLLNYSFSIVVLMFMKDEDSIKENWSTVGLCMWTLAMDGTLMDSTAERLKDLLDLGTMDGYIVLLIVLVYMLLSAITVMNMLIGVLCEVVGAVAAEEKEEA